MMYQTLETGSALLGLVIKPILLNRICDYRWNELLGVLGACFRVTLVAVPMPLLLFFFLNVNSLAGGCVLLFVSLLSVALAVWFLGLDSVMRSRLKQTVREKIRRYN